MRKGKSPLSHGTAAPCIMPTDFILRLATLGIGALPILQANDEIKAGWVVVSRDVPGYHPYLMISCPHRPWHDVKRDLGL